MSSTENETTAVQQALSEHEFIPQTPPGSPPPLPPVEEEEDADAEDAVQSERLIGQVKWFNNKAGYGFITSNTESQDIFAHYSTIEAPTAQYKYLVLGEYVEFTKSKSVNDKHEFQAMKITGINGGKLMCETRQINRMYQQQYQQQRYGEEGPSSESNTQTPVESKNDRPSRPPRQNSSSNNNARGPPPPTKRRTDADGFEQVDNRKRSNKKRNIQPTISS